MNQKKKQEGLYDAKKIQVLSGMVAVRKRPATYIGDTSVFGFHHLVYEVIDNSIDEAMAGFCSLIEVTVHPDNSVTVNDNGRGIPVDIHKTEGKPALEVVLTILHAGGKFDRKTYQVSGGLHGVGVSVVNALSEWLEAEVRRDGKVYHQKFSRGVPTGILHEVGKTRTTGTKITFKPDPEIFEVSEFDENILMSRLRDLAFLNPQIQIKFEDERKNRTETYHYETGLTAFVEYLNKGKTPLFTPPYNFKKIEEEGEVEVAFQYSDGYNETILSFVNNVNTREGGTHLTGFRSGLTRGINEYGKKYQLLEENFSLGGDDIREGLTALISVRIPEPQFEGQTKTKLGNSAVRTLVEGITFDKIYTFLEEHPEAAREILDKAMTAFKAREAARRARDLTRKKLADGPALSGKLADCSIKDPAQRELFIVEGESAGGSAKQGRDRTFQAILPLRGKIINTEKARLEKVLDNREIRTIISALGAGYGDEFDATKLRYHKVIIMADADVDGAHIRTLLLTFFYRQMTELIRQGYCYIAQPPLYKVKQGKKEVYVDTELEMEKILLDLGSKNVSLFNGKKKEPLDSSQARKIADLSKKFTDLEKIFIKRELDAKKYFRLAQKDTHKLPISKLILNGDIHYFYSDEEMAEFVEKNQLSNQNLFSGNYQLIDIYENRESEKLLNEAVECGLTPIFWETDLFFSKDGKEWPVSFEKVFDELKEVGRKGIVIQRYKGLGEMNPEQLQETTMDRQARRLLNVTIDDAAKAEEIFTVLMGEHVEPRRQFIQNYALEVRNLDI